ncbi:MAG: SGNH/GDSL hydrolase family protein [Planctomycetaceae bacterium]
MKLMRGIRIAAILVAMGMAPEYGQGQEHVARIPEAAELNGMHLSEPFWKSSVIHGESLIFFRAEEKGPAVGKLLYKPSKILAVKSADGKQTFVEGKDFRWDDAAGGLVALSESKVPVLTQDELYPLPGQPRSLPHKAGDPKRHVLFDNAHWFHDQQVEVTYQTEEKTGELFSPNSTRGSLPKTMKRLAEKQSLTIGVSGDSISHGYNASAFTHASPDQPPYSNLVAGELARRFGSSVQLHNRAISGWATTNGINDADKLIEAKPNLIIIAYGMNDVGRRNPKLFEEEISKLVGKFQAALPESEIILVSTMLGNENWTHSPREMFPKYREVLFAQAKEGVAVADMTTLWEKLLSKKRDFDLTGNGVNHPNDFGHRLYAQIVLELFGKAP